MRILVGLIVAALCYDGIVMAETPATRKVDLKDLAITIPSDWEILDEAETLLTARSPQEGPDDSYGEHLRLKNHPMGSPIPLEKLLEIQRDDAKRDFNIRGEGMLTGSTVPIAWLAIVPKDTSIAGDLTKIDYMFIHGNDLYAMHCMVESNKYEQFRPRFDAIAKTITPTQGANPTKPLFGNEAAHEQGKQLGRIFGYVMLAAIALWVLVALFRRVTAKR